MREKKKILPTQHLWFRNFTLTLDEWSSFGTSLKTSFSSRIRLIQHNTSILLTLTSNDENESNPWKNRIRRVISQTGNWVVRRTSIIPRQCSLSRGRYRFAKRRLAEISSIPRFFWIYRMLRVFHYIFLDESLKSEMLDVNFDMYICVKILASKTAWLWKSDVPLFTIIDFTSISCHSIIDIH